MRRLFTLSCSLSKWSNLVKKLAYNFFPSFWDGAPDPRWIWLTSLAETTLTKGYLECYWYQPVSNLLQTYRGLGPGHTAAGFSIMIGRGRSGRDRKNLQRGHTTFSVSRWSALAAAAACTWMYSVCLSVLLFSRWSPSPSRSLSLFISVSLPLPLAIAVSIRFAIALSLSHWFRLLGPGHTESESGDSNSNDYRFHRNPHEFSHQTS